MEDMLSEMYFKECMESPGSVWRYGLARSLQLESVH